MALRETDMFGPFPPYRARCSDSRSFDIEGCTAFLLVTVEGNRSPVGRHYASCNEDDVVQVFDGKVPPLREIEISATVLQKVVLYQVGAQRLVYLRLVSCNERSPMVRLAGNLEGRCDRCTGSRFIPVENV